MKIPQIQQTENTAQTLFAQGNKALQKGDYCKAIGMYGRVIALQSELPKYLSSNLSIARRKYRVTRQSVEKQSVAVCGWDLGHNAAGRVYTLATLYETFAHVEIIGSLFPCHGRTIWEPIRYTSIAKHTFIVEEESKFLEQAFQLVAAHPYDIVHLSKPRIPNIFFGIIYKLLWDAKVLLDIDDEELAFVEEQTPARIDSYLKQFKRLPELQHLFGKDWTRIAVALSHVFDGCTVANHALQQRYGGQIIGHARDEALYQPSPIQRQASRVRFGIASDKKVVLFLGTPREYKGLVEIAQAITRLKRQNIVFVIVGDFPEDGLKEQLLAIAGVNYAFIGNQPIGAVPEILAMGDVCVLLQDPQSVAARYQTPGKLSDALACGLPVLATETPALCNALIEGALLPVNQKTLPLLLSKVLSNENTAQDLRQAGLDFFQRELSFAANVPRLQQVMQKCEKQFLSIDVDVLGDYIDRELLSSFRRFSKKNTQIVSKSRTNSDPIPNLKIAVAVHIDYPELWSDIARRLKSLSAQFDLFVTTTLEHAETVTNSVQMDFPDVRIDIQPNYGMDIVPFLCLVPTLINEGYLIVCKLHTKKGVDEQGILWRNVMLDALIGDNATFVQITSAFSRESSLQMAGPASLYMSTQKLMLDNSTALETLFQQLEGRPLPHVDWGFFNGTMFWTRPSLLENLAQHIVQNIDQFETDYKKDGQFVHAIERLFGLLPALQYGQIGLLHSSCSLKPTYILQISSAYISPSQAWLGDLMRQFEYLDADRTLLEQSDLFDYDYYRQQCSNLTNTDIDFICHYLLIGRFEGKTPNPDFDPTFYSTRYKDQLQDGGDPLLHYLREGAQGDLFLRPTKEQEKLEIPSFRYRALNTGLIDWSALTKEKRDPNKISIIIPVYNNSELTRDCIESLYIHTSVNRFELVVVDNGSDDITRTLLDQFAAKYANLVVLRSEENLNFALGCNLGFAASHGDKVIFLNSDTTVTENWLEPLLEPLSSTEISAVQPRLLFPDGAIQCMGVVFSAKSSLGYPLYRGMQPKEPWAGRSRKFQAVTGACMVLRAEDFAKVRGFDPIYINGQEDIDLCLRLNLSDNRRAWLAAESIVYHHESKSVNRNDYIRGNRQVFIKRWREEIQADDKNYYLHDGFVVQEYKPDVQDSCQTTTFSAWCPILMCKVETKKEQDLNKSCYCMNEHGLEHIEDAIRNTRIKQQCLANNHTILKDRWSKYSKEMIYESSGEGYIEETISKIELPDVQQSNLKVSIIIAVYGKLKYTLRCLQSISENSPPCYELILIDDLSPDNSSQYLPRIRNIHYCKNTENMGFLLSCNRGIGMSKGGHILFLNNDTEVMPGWLDELLHVIEKPDVGAVGSKLVYPDGSLQEAGGIYWNDAQGTNYGRMELNPDKSEYNFLREVDKCSGASLLVRKEVIEATGGFDPRFAPAYKEDADICFEVRQLGYKVIYQPKSVVVHYEGISCGSDVTTGIKQYQVLNRPKFIDKWRDVLKTDHFENNRRNVFLARSRPPRAKYILIIDDKVPEYDRHAGGLGMFQYSLLLKEMGYKVIYYPDNKKKTQPYTDELTQYGIEVKYETMNIDFKSWIEEYGKYIDYVWLSRPTESIKYLDCIQKHSKAKLLYCGRDLHYLRHHRRYELENDPDFLKSSQHFKNIEFELFDKVDEVLLFSDVEKDLLVKEGVNSGKIKIIPAYYYEERDQLTLENRRKDLIFVGGFKHKPNIDAVLWFVEYCFPHIERQFSESTLMIVGPNPTNEILCLKRHNIDVLGFVEKLDNVYEKARVTIAPIRYGAGVKGKIVNSLSFGIPVVTTTIGAEGMSLQHEKNCLIADAASSFAEEVNRLMNDSRLWQQLSDGALDFVKEYYSKDAARQSMLHLLN